MSTNLSSVLVRKASPEDVPIILEIKEALRLHIDASANDGGFLLGSVPAVYEQLASAGQIALLVQDDCILGFSTMLDDHLFRASEVFERREQIDWDAFSPQEVMEESLAYFDQLAIHPAEQRGYLGAFLAMHTMDTLTEEAAHVFTTTLIEPVENRAALPLIHKIGGRQVGTLTEHYPDVGQVTSAIFHLPREGYRAAIAHMRDHGSARERETIAIYDAWRSTLREREA
mgnify:CR=1 FL=1